MILDNLDDHELFHTNAAQGQGPSNPATRPLLDYIPRKLNGSVIITSRSQDIALQFVQDSSLIQIEPMERSEALELLNGKIDFPEEEFLQQNQESLELVEELEYMPLAIIQAAAYIKHRASRCSVSQYLQMFRQSDRHATSLLKYKAGRLYRDWEAKNAILVTWQISFNFIQRTRPSAADLLSLMCFFDRHGISEHLLRKNIGRDHCDPNLERPAGDSSDEEIDTMTEFDADQDFEDDVFALKGYSFIHIEDQNLFTMHRLVQLAARVWLVSNNQGEHWKEQFIMRLSKEFPDGNYENWVKCQSLFPHVKAALSQRPDSAVSTLEWASLLYRGAWYAFKKGNTTDMREMVWNSRKQRIRIMGKEADESLSSTLMLANAYWLEGRYKDAEKLELQVVEIHTVKFGKNHHHTLISMSNLAATYNYQGRIKEAKELQIQVLETRKIILGVDHPSTLTSMVNLAATYSDLGQWEEAKELNIQVLKARRAELGEDHPSTLRSSGHLASTYRQLGQWEEAEKLEEMVMATLTRKLGEHHPDTLTSMDNLALTYQRQGRWKEAENLEARIIETRKTYFGEGHLNTLTSMSILALTYQNQGRWKEEEELETQVLELRKVKLGEFHPDTLASMQNLACAFGGQGRGEDAENLLIRVFEGTKSNFGMEHPDTLTIMNNLASTYSSRGRWEEAERYFLQVIKTRQATIGKDHPSTLVSIQNLASMYKNQGQWEKAEKLEIQATERPQP